MKGGGGDDEGRRSRRRRRMGVIKPLARRMGHFICICKCIYMIYRVEGLQTEGAFDVQRPFLIVLHLNIKP
jgi:hypothetical protein